MKEIKLTEEEIKELIVNALREKVATRYTFTIVDQLVDDVMKEEGSREKLRHFVRETLNFVKDDKQFEKKIKEEFQTKIAKAMVGKLEGTVERAVDVLRQDPMLRAQMILALEKIISKVPPAAS